MKREWSEGVQKAWVCYEIFRRLGFTGDQISYGAVRGVALGTVTCVVRVQVQVGGKEFGIHAALWPLSEESFVEEWDAFGDELVSGGIEEQELQQIYRKYSVEYSEVPRALMQKGIRIPLVRG